MKGALRYPTEAEIDFGRVMVERHGQVVEGIISASVTYSELDEPPSYWACAVHSYGRSVDHSWWAQGQTAPLEAVFAVLWKIISLGTRCECCGQTVWLG